MSIRTLAADVGILLAVAAAGAGAGFVRGQAWANDRNASELAKAHAATIAADNEKAGLEGVLATVRKKLDAQANELRQAHADAEAALRDRDKAQAQRKAADAARAALRSTAHESPDCADLARLPICPAVSDRLFRYGIDKAQPAAASSR